MKYDTALREPISRRIEEIERADIVVGIPCFNCEDTVGKVIETVSVGLTKHYNSMKSVIFISDGGSTDDTREVARDAAIKPWQEKIVSIYRGPPGKGTAFRALFEAIQRLDAKVCVVIDADLKSIKPDWIKYLIEPILEKGYQFVAPLYSRHKYDGTITNNIVYNMTRALYGKRIRQPIGGDFGFSSELAEFYQSEDVWDTDVSRFGIDIWMTISAITNNFRICQSNLSVKIHKVKDPAIHLGHMFREVVMTLFSLIEKYENYWMDIKGSEAVETFGLSGLIEPEPIFVDLERLVENFRLGFKYFGVLWYDILPRDIYKELERLVRTPISELLMPIELWVRLLYHFASTFHEWPDHRFKLVDIMTPLYYGRVASFVNQTKDLSYIEAEKVVEEQALTFEENKGYLIKLWKK